MYAGGIFSKKYPTEVFGKVRYGPSQYPTEHSGEVPDDLDTGTRHLGKLGTTTKNAPGTRTPYRAHACYILYCLLCVEE